MIFPSNSMWRWIPRRTNVGGWVMEQMGCIPAAGDSFTYESLKIEVARMEKHRIEEVRVFRLPAPPALSMESE